MKFKNKLFKSSYKFESEKLTKWQLHINFFFGLSRLSKHELRKIHNEYQLEYSRNLYDIYSVKYALEPLSFYETNIFLTLPVIYQILFFFRIVCLVISDSILFYIRKQQLHLFGIWCYVGLPGSGKTMSLVYYLDGLRRKYGDRIFIITNFSYIAEDAPLLNWKEALFKEYDKPVVFAWDELQNEFNSRQYRDFPISLVHELTQNRKGNGKQIIYTTQTFSAVDNNFRNLTHYVYDCRTYFGRFTSMRKYRREFYEALIESKSIDRKFKNRPIEVVRFIQSDYLRSRYNSFLRLDYLKNLKYEDRSKSKFK